MNKRYLTMIVGMFLAFMPLNAQKVSISTDLLGYACLGTMNVDISYALSQKWSLNMGVRYNPFTFRQDQPQRQFRICQRSMAIGVRLWPWHTGSGWWFAGKLRGQEYNWGGILSKQTKEGIRFGAGVYMGYTHMISRHFNIEFGAGMWGGYTSYRRYACQVCGVTVDSGKGAFLSPDDISVSLVYVF